jgi:hypothetical protein
MRRLISGGDRALGQQCAEEMQRVHVGRNRPGPVGAAAGDGAGGAAALDDDLLDRRIEDDLDALRPRRPGHRLRDRAHPADRVAPGARHPRRLAEEMMEEDVGGAGS